LAGAALVVVMGGGSLAAPLVCRWLPASARDPNAQDFAGALGPHGEPLAPSLTRPLGTDMLGRDELARLLYGGRQTLAIGVGATLLSLALGLCVGMSAGLGGGAVDALMMRGVDLVLGVPSLLLCIALATALGGGSGTALVALILTSFATPARVVRAKARGVWRAPHVEAARALGASPERIVFRHVLPHVVGPALALAAAQAGAILLAEASLSFLGIGVRPPWPSWGAMLASGEPYLRAAPWLTIAPAAAIVLTVLGFHLVGDALGASLEARSS
jgi:ABC-type dipeptide/oligopeptide/nickel transport system permease subunit